MKPFSHRNKLLGGVFGLVAVVWGLDLLTGEAGPELVGAALPPVADAAPVPPPVDPPDLAAVMESLRGDHAARPLLPFDQVTRDLFVPTASMEAALARAASASDLRAETSERQPVTEDQPFDARHSLQGVLTGRVSLASIDGNLVRQGAVIDGYRLVELHRDYVVFEREGSRVILRVATANRSEQPEERPETNEQAY
jgi:hypothetical protein